MNTIFSNPLVLEMIAVVKQYHITQSRNNGRVPYAQHCLSAAEIMSVALTESGEAPEDESSLVALVCACLGHDLLEDTAISRELIKEKFGDATLALIEAVTNDGGDARHEEYMQKLMVAPEEALLIKYGDLIDNTISIAYGLPDLGYEWANTFYLPIMKGTEKLLFAREFTQFHFSASILRKQYLFSRERLLDNLAKYAPDVKWK